MEAPRLPSMVTWWCPTGMAKLKHTTSSKKRETTSQRMRRHLQATAQQALQREGSTSPGTGSLPTMFVGFAGGLTHNDGENLVCGSPSSPGILSMFVLCVTCCHHEVSVLACTHYCECLCVSVSLPSRYCSMDFSVCISASLCQCLPLDPCVCVYVRA